MTCHDSTVEWVLIGGGVAGMASALSLTGQLQGSDSATDGHIVILDAHRLAHGSSLHNPGRGQGGFHYPDWKSAEDLQDILAHNLIHYPDWFGKYLSRTPDGQFVRSWYTILPDDPGAENRSIFPNTETVELFEHLANRWEGMRQANPALRLIGDEPFMQWVESTEAVDVFGTDMYFKVAKTIEPNLDVPGFLANMRSAVQNSQQVSVVEDDVVLSIDRLPQPQSDAARFAVTTLHEGQTSVIRTRHINVCAWEATESLLAPLGYEFNTLNRIKCGFDLKLSPDSIDFPSTIAIYGPHVMVRNFYDGTAFSTIATISNITKERVPDVDATLTNLILHKHDDREQLIEHVLEQLALYYPNLGVEEISNLEFGVVKVFSQSGKIDLSDPHGDQNFRESNGFSAYLEPGMWMTWSMKLVSCFTAAEQFRESALAHKSSS